MATMETEKVKIGSKIPDHTFQVLSADKKVTKITSKELFDGKKVVIFGLPGAFTPTCSGRHLPGFVEDAEKIKQLGVDTIACISVNDPFVMHHWGKEHNADGKVLMLADGDASFTRKMGLEKDTGDFGGIRSKRFLAHVNNGVVTHFAVDEDGKFEVSSSESSLSFISSSLASM